MLKVSIGAVPSLIDLAGKSKVNVLMVGNPGVGKSAIINSMADDGNTKVVQFTGSSTYEESVNGIPYRDTSDDLQKYLEPGWLRDIWDYVEANPKGRVILFIDEFNTAEPQVLKTFLSILTERKVPTQKRALPSNTVIVAAMNPCNQNNGEELIRPLASRFLTVEITSSLDSYKEYVKGKAPMTGSVDIVKEPNDITEEQKIYLLDQLSPDDWNAFKDGDYHEINPRSFTYFVETLKWVKNPQKQCQNLSMAFFGKKLTLPGSIEEEKAKRAERVKSGVDYYTEAELKALSDDELVEYFKRINQTSTLLGGGTKATNCRMTCRRIMAERGIRNA